MSEVTFTPVQPTLYAIKDKVVPAGLTIAQREVYIKGLGVSPAQAAVFAMQDRASSALAVLQSFIEKTGDQTAVAKASATIDKWNKECDEFFKMNS